MATKTISESVIANISKGPLFIFVLMGVGIWQASNMSGDQLNTLNTIIDMLNNPIGFAVYSIIMLALLYSLVLFPVGRFLSKVVQDFFEAFKVHDIGATEHYEASKKMFHDLQALVESHARLQDRFDEFYGKRD